MHPFNYFHGHFYFSPETMTSAEVVRQKMMIELTQLIRVFPLLPRQVGPHPYPMFEFHFRGSDYEVVKAWLEKNRNGHSILLHPLSGNDIQDHTQYAEFLGPELGLNIDFLKAL
jgi:aromatic ring-cleaving dioxygenase